MTIKKVLKDQGQKTINKDKKSSTRSFNKFVPLNDNCVRNKNNKIDHSHLQSQTHNFLSITLTIKTEFKTLLN